MRARHVFIFVISLLALAACDSEETGYKDWSFLGSVKNGVLGAPPISGMQYRTSSHSGLTGAGGEFSYRDGQQVSFSIGDITLPRIAAKPLIKLVDFDGGSETQRVRNIRRLLLTLDTDGNPANGITIDQVARDASRAALVDFNQPTDSAFEANVANFLARAKPANPVLVTLSGTVASGTTASPAASAGSQSPSTPEVSTSGTPTALEPPRRLAVNAAAIEGNIVSEDGAGYVFAAQAGVGYTITVTPKTSTDDPELFVFRNLADMRNYWSVEAVGGVDSPEATALRVGISTNQPGLTETVTFVADRTGDYFIMLIDTANRGDYTLMVTGQ